MTTMSQDPPNLWNHPDATAVLEGVSTVFASLGRALICLGPDFRVVHTSTGLDELAGAGARQAVTGKLAEEILGTRLFGDDGMLARPATCPELPGRVARRDFLRLTMWTYRRDPPGHGGTSSKL